MSPDRSGRSTKSMRGLRGPQELVHQVQNRHKAVLMDWTSWTDSRRRIGAEAQARLLGTAAP
jgi:hypothetical protein